jgi:hypothetical protein
MEEIRALVEVKKPQIDGFATETASVYCDEMVSVKDSLNYERSLKETDTVRSGKAISIFDLAFEPENIDAFVVEASLGASAGGYVKNNNDKGGETSGPQYSKAGKSIYANNLNAYDEIIANADPIAQLHLKILGENHDLFMAASIECEESLAALNQNTKQKSDDIFRIRQEKIQNAEKKRNSDMVALAYALGRDLNENSEGDFIEERRQELRKVKELLEEWKVDGFIDEDK